MEYDELLKQLNLNHGGIIQIADVTNAGIPKSYFYTYVVEKNLERVSHGIYVSKDTWIDEMYILSLRSQQAVFSHESALYLHNLTDREPLENSITVKTGYNPTKLKEDGIKVYTIKKELYHLGLTEINTPFGHMVKVYDMERTICDIVRSRRNIEIQTFQDALRSYVRRKDKNVHQLMEYANKFRIEKIMNQYLELLL